MTVVDLKPLLPAPGRLDQQVVLHELAAVVCGDAPEFLAEVWRSAFNAVDRRSDRGCSPIRDPGNDLFPGESLRQSQETRAAAFASDDQIHLPVSRLLAIIDVLRPDLDTWKICMSDLWFVIVLFLSGFALRLFQQISVSQIQEQSSGDVVVQGAHADPGSKPGLPGLDQSCRRRVRHRL